MTTTTEGRTVHLQLGVAAGPLPLDASQLTPELAAELASLGLSAVVTHFDPHPQKMSAEEADRIRRTLADEGIRIVQAAGFRTSLVEPDDRTRVAGLDELAGVLANTRRLGADMFLTGCGSLSPNSFYATHPGNHTDETRARLVDSLRRAARMAEAEGVVFALECHQLTTLDTAANIRRMLDEVASEHVKANFDPVNLLGDLPSVYGSADAMWEMAETLRPHLCRAGHAKDVAVHDHHPLHLSEAAPGEGVLDFEAFLAICATFGEGAAVVVEHLPAEPAIAALGYLRDLGPRCGISFDRVDQSR